MREKEQKLFRAITNVREDYIEEACSEEEVYRYGANAEKRIKKGLLTAASVALLLMCGIGTFTRFDYFKAGCGAFTGTVADGIYYYQVPHDGIYAYTPEGNSKKLLSIFWVDDWQVNDYGLYFVCGKTLFVRPHETGKWERLYKGENCTHIRLNLQQDGNVIVEAYHKRKKIIYELLVDGKTGAILETVMQPTPYGVYYKNGKYSDLHYQVGERRLELQNIGKEFVFRLCENGGALLPEDTLVYRYEHHYYGDTLVLCGYRDEFNDADYELLVVLRPDGKDTILTVENGNYSAGTDEYLFYSKEEEVWCLALSDGETWKLEANVESATDFYDLTADRAYLYSCAPWKHEQECWRLEYDEDGRPRGLKLVDGDILK